MGSENRAAGIIGAVALLVAAGAAALERWIGGEVILTAVIAAATIAYTGFAWRLVRSAEVERDLHLHMMLRALLVELEQNLHRKGQTNVWVTDVPFEHGALDLSASLRLGLPDPLPLDLHEVSARIARYNILVAFEFMNPTGRAVADQINQLAEDVYASLDVVIPNLRRHAGLPPR